MLQDSLQIVPPAAFDTVPAAPADIRPLPAGEPLQMYPAALDTAQWQHGLLRFENMPPTSAPDSTLLHYGEITSYNPAGMAGEPLPYCFRTDDIVTSFLLLSFFLVAFVTAYSRRFLSAALKDFFHKGRRSERLTTQEDNSLRGKFFLVFQTSFLLGILFYDYAAERLPEACAKVSPYYILGVAVLLCILCYWLKMLLQRFVGNVFFDAASNRRWTDAANLCIFLAGIFLFPLVLLVVYFDLDFALTQTLFLFTFLFIETLLAYKCFCIFFGYAFGWVHLILYFCTLEIAPLVILWRSLHVLTGYLAAIEL